MGKQDRRRLQDQVRHERVVIDRVDYDDELHNSQLHFSVIAVLEALEWHVPIAHVQDCRDVDHEGTVLWREQIQRSPSNNRNNSAQILF